MNSKNKISEAELEIMKIVWERQEARSKGRAGTGTLTEYGEGPNLHCYCKL